MNVCPRSEIFNAVGPLDTSGSTRERIISRIYHGRVRVRVGNPVKYVSTRLYPYKRFFVFLRKKNPRKKTSQSPFVGVRIVIGLHISRAHDDDDDDDGVKQVCAGIVAVVIYRCTVGSLAALPINKSRAHTCTRRPCPPGDFPRPRTPSSPPPPRKGGVLSCGPGATDTGRHLSRIRHGFCARSPNPPPPPASAIPC